MSNPPPLDPADKSVNHTTIAADLSHSHLATWKGEEEKAGGLTSMAQAGQTKDSGAALPQDKIIRHWRTGNHPNCLLSGTTSKSLCLFARTENRGGSELSKGGSWEVKWFHEAWRGKEGGISNLRDVYQRGNHLFRLKHHLFFKSSSGKCLIDDSEPRKILCSGPR